VGARVAGGSVAGAELFAGGFAVGFDPFVIGITAVGGRLVAIPQAERATIETSQAACNKILISLLSSLIIKLLYLQYIRYPLN
jgi:hypothetical protein